MEEFDEGFARNLNKLFDRGLFRGMGGRELRKVELTPDKEFVRFIFKDGLPITFGVEGDCCSTSWIEHLESPESVEGREIVSVTDERYAQETIGECDELRQSYQTIFRLDNGESIKLEYRNDSNGYYGGYLVRIGSDGYEE